MAENNREKRRTKKIIKIQRKSLEEYWLVIMEPEWVPNTDSHNNICVNKSKLILNHPHEGWKEFEREVEWILIEFESE